MNTIRDNELAMPSGYEVESATIVPPIEAGATPVTYGSGIGSGIGSSQQSGIREKLDQLRSRGAVQLSHLKSRGSEQLSTLKSRGTETLHHLQHELRDRSAIAKSSLQSNAQRQVTNMNSSMRTNPMKWVGIAAGAGFGIGLIGRFVHWRNHHKRMAPQLVIIESSC